MTPIRVRLKSLVVALGVAANLAAGCYGNQRPSDLSRPHEVDAFVSEPLRIALGMSKTEVRAVIANGRQMHHGKYYAFKAVDDSVYQTDSWLLTYGPEVPGMGRVDSLGLAFKNNKVVKIVVATAFCP